MVIPGTHYLIIIDLRLWCCQIIYGSHGIIRPGSYENSTDSPSEKKNPPRKTGGG